MKKYIGTKTIMAQPMAKSEAEQVLNRSLSDAKGGEDGYLIEYPDGYKSWSPKEAFEKAYQIAETILDRMRVEYAQLKERIIKLDAFHFSEEFRSLPEEKRIPLINQHKAMSSYIYELGKRIDIEKTELQKQEAEQAASDIKRANESLIGLTIVEAGRCDFCSDEPTNCKRLMLADGSHICVKDMTKVPSKA